MSDCENPCQKIDCGIPNDLRQYSLGGLPPEELPFVPGPPLAFVNEAVFFNALCPISETPEFSGSLPGWIQLDQINNRFVGRAGTFQGDTQNNANAAAQLALNNFVVAAATAGQITCDVCGGNPSVLADMVWLPGTIDPGVTISGSGDTINASITNNVPNTTLAGYISAILCNPTNADVDVTFTFTGTGTASGSTGTQSRVRLSINGGGSYSNLFLQDLSGPTNTPVTVTVPALSIISFRASADATTSGAGSSSTINGTVVVTSGPPFTCAGNPTALADLVWTVTSGINGTISAVGPVVTFHGNNIANPSGGFVSISINAILCNNTGSDKTLQFAITSLTGGLTPSPGTSDSVVVNVGYNNPGFGSGDMYNYFFPGPIIVGPQVIIINVPANDLTYFGVSLTIATSVANSAVDGQVTLTLT